MLYIKIHKSIHMQLTMAICRQGEKHKKRLDPEWQKERFFFLDPKRDKVGFISTKTVTKLLGRKPALKKRPTLLRAQVTFLILSFLKFMRFTVLVLSSLGSSEQTSGSDFSKNLFVCLFYFYHCGKRDKRGPWQRNWVTRKGRQAFVCKQIAPTRRAEWVLFAATAAQLGQCELQRVQP